MNYKNITQYIQNNLLLIILLIFISYWYISNITGALSNDEVNFRQLAQSLITGSDMYIWADHPKLGHWILTFSLVATDWSPIGARIPSFILSIFTLVLIYEITKMFSNKYIGLLTVMIVSSINIFGSNAVIGILDMSLLFFVILLLYLMIKYLQQTENIISKKTMLILLGAVSAGISNIKYFGFFFALTAFLFIFYIETKNMKIRIKDSKIKYYFAAFIIMNLLIYLPYFSFDTENIRNRINADVENMGGYFGNEKYNLSNPMISLFVLVMPYLPSIFYLFARSFAVQIFFNTSQAPWWTYLNMIWVYGGIIYTVGLLLSLIIIIHKYYKKKLDIRILFLSIYSIIPLLFFSLVGTKLIKYMLPFFVLFTILILIISYNSMNQLVFLSKRTKILSVILFVILLISSIIPVPQIFVMYGSSSIKADSKYDVASQELNDYINNTDKTEIFLLVDSTAVLNYYIHFQNNTNFNIQYAKCSAISKFNYSICLEYKNKKSNKTINMYLIPYWFNLNNFDIYALLKDDKFDRIIMANGSIYKLNTQTKLYNNSKVIYIYSNPYTG